MKKIAILLCIFALALCACSCNEDADAGSEKETVGNITDTVKPEETIKSNSNTPTSSRDPMPKYEKLGVNNSIATTDGRYIYYICHDSTNAEAVLCRLDMNGQNKEELWAQQDLSDLYVDDGYLYISHGRVADRIDIATAPNYFMGKDGYVANKSIIGDASTRDFRGMSLTCTDDEYVYFASSGIYRVKKDTTGLEQIVYGEDFVNFYDLQALNGYLYAYCGDDQKIYRMNTDGSDITEICKPMESHVIYTDSVYYIVSGDNHTQVLTKTDLNGTETSALETLNEGWGNVSILNAMDNKIYFLHRADNHTTYTLRAYDITTASINDIYTFESETMVNADADIVDNYIFLNLEMSGNKTLFKMNTDGTAPEELSK